MDFELSIVRHFLKECCELGGKAPNHDLREAYGQFCARRGYEPLDARRFGRTLTELGYGTGRSGQSRYRKGLQLKPWQLIDQLATIPNILVYDHKGRPTPPPHLSTAISDWWRAVVEGFELEEHHLRILTNACEIWDRGQKARKVLEEDGFTYINSHGNHCARPEVAIQEKAELSFSRLIRELGIDGDELDPDPRVPRLTPRKRRAP